MPSSMEAPPGGPVVYRPLRLLTDLTADLQEHRDLAQLLELIVARTARLLGTERATLSLLDPTGTRLLAVCRTGAPLHENPSEEFELGEGLIGWIAANAKPIRVDDGASDPRFAARTGMIEAMGAFLGTPLVVGRVCLGVLSSVHPQAGYFTEEHQLLLTLLAGICSPYVEIARLERLASVDPLTGALNRRGLDEVLPLHEERKNASVTSLCMIDIDHFKSINDRFGHAIGDIVLKRLAATIADVVRKGDSVVRWGGEEFLVVLPGCGLSEATEIAERTRVRAAETVVTVGTEHVTVTVSAGVAQRRPGETRDDIIERTDAALYEAKHSGRNRVVTGSNRRV